MLGLLLHFGSSFVGFTLFIWGMQYQAYYPSCSASGFESALWIHILTCRIWGFQGGDYDNFHGGDYEECRVLGYGAVWVLKNQRFGGTCRLHLQGRRAGKVLDGCCTNTFFPRWRILLPWRWRRHVRKPHPRRRHSSYIDSSWSSSTTFSKVGVAMENDFL
jgi:hypothetical protein